MTYPIFPTLPGQGWSVKRTPTWSTRRIKHASGREATLALWSQPLYAFELTFDGLASNGAFPSLGRDTLQILQGFFLQCQGGALPFVYSEPSDRLRLGQPCGVGDGSTTAFTLMVDRVGFQEIASWVLYVDAVYLDAGSGAQQQLGNWNLAQPNQIVFTGSPVAGARISVDYALGYLCRFDADTQDFEQFMANLWLSKSVKFTQTRSF